MSVNGLESVIEKAKQAKRLDPELFGLAVDAMKAAFPEDDFTVATQLISHQPTEAVLHLVDEHLPGWTITLKGTAHATDGDWHCTLRKSDTFDDDAVIGSGTGPTLALAVLTAILKACILRAQP